MRTYFPIVFMQGDEAAEVLAILDRDGEQAAIDYLAQWDFGRESEHDPESPPWGSADRLFRSGPYILSYNLRLAYVGLCRVVDSETMTGPAPRWSAEVVTFNPATA